MVCAIKDQTEALIAAVGQAEITRIAKIIDKQRKGVSPQSQLLLGADEGACENRFCYIKDVLSGWSSNSTPACCFGTAKYHSDHGIKRIPGHNGGDNRINRNECHPHFTETGKHSCDQEQAS
jgi:hypothetical protein